MTSRKKKQDRKRRLRKRQRGHPKKHPLLGRDVKVIPTPPGMAKISEVFQEFLAPYSETWETEDQFHKLLTVGMIAWNAALHSGQERADFLDEMVGAFPPEARQDLRAILADLIHRKETLYADDHRVILDYQVKMEPEGPRLSVLSTLPDR